MAATAPRDLADRELILIDLDGTLVDSVPDLADAVDEMLRRLSMPARGEARVREWIGNGAERLVRRALIDRKDGEPDEQLFRRAYPLFNEAYAAGVCRRTVPYPGVREGLEQLREDGHRMGCVTNKPARFTEPLLETLGLRGFFEIVLGGDALPVRKPDPGPLLHAARTLGVPPERGLMVGDSISDVKAARAAGFAVVCVPYGYNHGEDIREADPDAVIDSLDELPALLRPRLERPRRSGNDA